MARGPLTGRRVVVTRASEQASSLAQALTERGAEVIEVPTIAIVEPSDGGRSLRESLGSLATFDWLVITSPNGAARVAAILAAATLAEPDAPSAEPAVSEGLAGREVSRGSRVVPDVVEGSRPGVLVPAGVLVAAGVKVAAVGPGTAAALEELGVAVDLVPQRFVAEGLLADFPPPPVGGGRVLLAQAAGARPVLVDGLVAKGWTVERAEAYRTIHPPLPADLLAQTVGADAITFTSASTVRGWIAAAAGAGSGAAALGAASLGSAVSGAAGAGAVATPGVVASIGPVTSAAVREVGLEVTVEADPHTIDGLISALADALGAPPSS